MKGRDGIPAIGGDGDSGGVLHILRRLEPGPDAYDALSLAGALQQNGQRMLVAGSAGRFSYEFKRFDAEVLDLPLDSENPWRLYRNVKSLFQLIRSRRIELVHVHDAAPGWSAALATRHAGVPLFKTFHNLPDEATFLHRRYNAAILASARAIAPCDAVFDQLMNGKSPQDVQEHQARFDSRRSGNVSLIRGGVDLSIFDPVKVSAERLIALSGSWRLPDDKPLILLPGRPEGFELLLSSLKDLSDLDFTCVFAARHGEALPAERETLETAIAREGLSDRVFVAEPCRDMAAALKLADVVVLPSMRPQGFRRMIAEAQALGCPVVATNVGGAAEQIDHGRTGFLVERFDRSSLADEIKSALLLSSEARESLLGHSITSVRARFDQRRMTDETLALYKDVLAELRPSGE